MAGDRRVAEPTAAIPHPYPDGAAEAWIATHADLFANRRGVCYAITLATSGELVGAISLLDLSMQDKRAEVGYWVGLPHWGLGYCSEALAQLMTFAESHLGISRFVGRCLASNLGSARVLEKSGFTLEGRQVKQVMRTGRYHDMLLFGRCTASRDV